MLDTLREPLNTGVALKVVGFGEDDLRALAGARSFERGLGYLNAVSGLEVGNSSVTAVVHGTDVYEVEITLGGRAGISGWCDCPYGQEGNFCKHCVAVGLAMLRQAEAVPRQRAAARVRTSGLEVWLTALSRDELLALVREQIAEGRELRRRLELRAAAARSDLGTVRDRILTLIDPRPFARYGYVECWCVRQLYTMGTPSSTWTMTSRRWPESSRKFTSETHEPDLRRQEHVCRLLTSVIDVCGAYHYDLSLDHSELFQRCSARQLSAPANGPPRPQPTCSNP